MDIDLRLGDCLEVLRGLPDHSVDSLVCDPPCGIGFMGLDFDKNRGGRDQWVAWLTEILSECRRVMRPGAIGAVWSLPRTQHWTAWACEDAGFRIWDNLGVAHVFGSGFPKGQSISNTIRDKLIDSCTGFLECEVKFASGAQIYLQTKSLTFQLRAGVSVCTVQWSANKSIENAWQILESGNVSNVGKILPKSQTEIGLSTQKSDFAVDSVRQKAEKQQSRAYAKTAENSFTGPQSTEKTRPFALSNAAKIIMELCSLAEYVEDPSEDSIPCSIPVVFSVQLPVSISQCEKAVNKIKEEGVPRIELGEWLSLAKVDINVLCVGLQSDLRHTILNQSRTFRSCDTSFQTGFVSAMTATITKSMEDSLITSTGVTWEEKNVSQPWEGWRTPAIKPGFEFWVLIQAPPDGSIVENVLRHGVGGVNIDATRVPVDWESDPGNRNKRTNGRTNDVYGDLGATGGLEWHPSTQGRYPANFAMLHHPDCTEDQCHADCPVEEMGRQSGWIPSSHRPNVANKNYSRDFHLWGDFDPNEKYSNSQHPDTGTAARYFHQFRYEGKASPRDRSELCRDLLWRRDKDSSIGWVQVSREEYDATPDLDRAQGNIHATVKNTSLMDFLVTLTTPPGGTVLDPFMGSGSTGVAAVRKGFGFVGIEQEPGYLAIAQARIETAKTQPAPNPKSPKKPKAPDLEQRVESLEFQQRGLAAKVRRMEAAGQMSLFG